MTGTITPTARPEGVAVPPPVKEPGGPLTIGAMFLDSVDRFASRTAVRRKVKGQYVPLTYRELYEEVVGVFRGLDASALKRGDRLGIIAENRPEWIVVDLACQLLGIVTVPIYPTLPASQTEYILHDAECCAVVASDPAQLKKVQESWARLPRLRLAVVMDLPATEQGPNSPDAGEVVSLEALRDRGDTSALADREIRDACARVAPEDVSSVVYTSGTTGDPKGAMLIHRNFMSNAHSISTIIELQDGDVFLSFLPLNHVFERLGGYFFPLYRGACIAYAESALRVKQNLPEVEPTVMIGVPRLYDGLSEGVQASVAKAPERSRKMFERALAVGKRRAAALEQGRHPGPFTALQWAVVDRLILQKVRQKMGCGRIRYLVSGSAPLARTTAEFLLALGFQVLEGWGLTETSPVLTVNFPWAFRLGSVGRAIPGVEVQVADDGELIARGPNIMKGYLNKPDATAEAIDSEGWFHTGDIGRIDEDGYVFITDRKKDLLVLATGKKVAPQPIEAKLTASPYIREAVVLGDRMSSCVALIVPALDRLADTGKAQGWSATSPEDLCASPEAKKLMRGEIDRLSTDLAEYERIRQFALLPQEFTIEGGELTPTLKVKRKVVAEKYADVIARLGG